MTAIIVPHHIDWFDEIESFEDLNKRLALLCANIDDDFEFLAVTAQLLADAQIGASVQAHSAELDALAALSTTGLLARTGVATYATRTITAGTGISVANGDGVSGNPTITNTSPGISAAQVLTRITVNT